VFPAWSRPEGLRAVCGGPGVWDLIGRNICWSDSVVPLPRQHGLVISTILVLPVLGDLTSLGGARSTLVCVANLIPDVLACGYC